MDIIDTKTFREKLAGASAPSGGSSANDGTREEAIRLLAEMPALYSDDLDRKALWERIGSGVEVGVNKCGGNVENFLGVLLDHIKAPSGQVAANDHLQRFIALSSTRGEAWQASFLDTMRRKKQVLLVMARKSWNDVKGGK